VWIDRRGRVLVADRENDRVQVFDQNGKLLTIWPTKLIGPAVIYVDDEDIVYVVEHNAGLVSILTLDGERLAQWGDPMFKSCHGVACDSRGDLYVVRAGPWGRRRRIVKHVRVRK
jgi:peptidylglycine monooxygenase